MRPIMHGDVVAAARVLFNTPASDRDSVLTRLLCQTERADRFRKETGRMHPFWGDGSLMVAALRRSPPPEPRLDNLDYCDCLSQVFDALVCRGRRLLG